MALSECCASIDSQGRELIDHGNGQFPVACYQDDFRVMNVPWHWHPEWEAVYILEGSCTVAAGQQKQVLNAGDGFFINSGVLHGCWDLENSGCIFHSLVFHPRLISGSLDSAIHLNYVLPLMENQSFAWITFSPEIPWQQQALTAIEQAWQACVSEAPGYEFIVRSRLSDLCLLLWQQIPAGTGNQKSVRDSERIKSMLSYIHDNFAGTVTVTSIAASAAVSDSECLRCFRSAIGITPIQYLKQYRLQQASSLLLSSDRKSTDIAQECGFQDMSYFTKSFREQYGTTPIQYRKAERRS